MNYYIIYLYVFTLFVKPVKQIPFASSNMSPGCNIPVDHAAWCENKRLIRINPGNTAFESIPPDTDNPKPRGPFETCTEKQQSKILIK